jgi:hypothetical protein
MLALPCTVYRQSPSRKDTTRPVLHNPRDSALSIRSRPGLDPASMLNTTQQEGRTAWHGAPSHFGVSSSTSPWCPGMAFHSQGTSLQSPQQGSTKHHLKTPRRPDLLSPYKRVGRRTKKRNNGQQVGHKIEINISSNHPCILSSLFETWARRPLSQACNPYTSTSVQGNTNSLPLAGRRAFFCPNQDKPPYVLLASPSRIRTRSTHSSV